MDLTRMVYQIDFSAHGKAINTSSEAIASGTDHCPPPYYLYLLLRLIAKGLWLTKHGSDSKGKQDWKKQDLSQPIFFLLEGVLIQIMNLEYSCNFLFQIDALEKRHRRWKLQIQKYGQGLNEHFTSSYCFDRYLISGAETDLLNIKKSVNSSAATIMNNRLSI